MPSWWPFGGDSGAGRSAAGPSPSSDATDIPTTRGIQQTKTYENRASGAERDYGGSGLAHSEIDRFRDMNKIRRHNDGRAVVMDTESIDCLMNHYERQFQEADTHMKQRVAQESKLKPYDYENDRRYAVWKQDQEVLQERLQIHFLDTVIDDARLCLLYFLRISTTAGLCYGIGRTAYLYRTMDKTYAKLNGVTLSGLAFGEITSTIARSSGVALCASVGVSIGSGIVDMITAAASGEVSQPQRTWWNVVGAGATAGLCGGMAHIAMHHTSLTPWGMRAMLGAFTGAGAIGGLYLGYYVYRPFAAQRTHALYDPYWRPWHMRHLRMDGPTHVRGRYM